MSEAMDISIWTALITETGVPLAILAIVGYYGLKILKRYMESQQKKDEEHRAYLVERVEKSEKRQEELVSIGRELSETNRILSEKFTSELSEIKEEVSHVNSKIDVLTIKFDTKK